MGRLNFLLSYVVPGDFKKNFIFLIFLATLFLPLFLSGYKLHIMIIIFYYAAVASCWNLLAGYTGLFNLAQNAFAGIGAYSSGLILRYLGLPIPFSIAMAATISMLFAYGISQLTLKMRSIYLAVSTWAFTASLRIFMAASWEWTEGSMGLSIPRFFHKDIMYYYLFLFSMLFIVGIIYWILNSKIGLFVQAIRDDEVAAAVLGVDVFKWRKFVFVVSGLFTGLMGALLAHFVGIIDPTIFEFKEMGLMILMSVLGGYGTIPGPLIGATMVETLSEYLRALGALRLVLFGVLGVVVMIFLRGGIWSAILDVIKKFKKLK